MASPPLTSDMEALSLGVADAPPPSNRAMTVLDQEGDLRLEIGPEHAPFLVDSRALARVSPVWRRSLFGDAATTQRVQGRPWIVQLPDDDEQALGFLLGVAHGVLPRSPESVRHDEVCALSVTAAKFDMVHLLRPWAEGWCASLMKAGVTSFRGCADRLRVGWELGHAMLFNSMAMQILTDIEVTGDGRLVDPDGEPLSSNPSFASVDLLLESLALRRDGVIQDMLGQVDEAMRDLIDEISCHSVARTATGHRASHTAQLKMSSDCRDVLLGSLIRVLAGELLFPVPDSKDVFESVQGLRERLTSLLKTIEPMGWSTNDEVAGMGASRHTHCNPFTALAQKIEETARHVVDPQTVWDGEHITRHMLERAQRTGCQGIQLRNSTT